MRVQAEVHVAEAADAHVEQISAVAAAELTPEYGWREHRRVIGIENLIASAMLTR
ncbi:MAG: hypothetical protein QOI12_3994 [Alphaproteobacteria bacterium]|jgi:hypothetical protein|nr:hypothetical protein [Alphaproteobacteria bacterium]